MSNQDDHQCTAVDRILNDINAKLKQLMPDCVVVFCIEADDLHSDYLNDVAIEGQCRLIRLNMSATEYVSPTLERPTWLQVVQFANDSLLHINDREHVFLENVSRYKPCHYVDDGIPFYWLQMGS